MEGQGRLVLSREVSSGGKVYTLTVGEEDLSRLYPGMIRYTLRLTLEGTTLGIFRTNTLEYSPGVPLDAEKVARARAAEWETRLGKDPAALLASIGRPAESHMAEAGAVAEVLVIQGSPRADGNCSTLAGWAAEEAAALGRKARVAYLDDLSIRPCIGCYQCYNTGSCTFGDDMTGLIAALRSAALLVVCTPVYTNTVPGGLKIFIDRCQAYHAEKSLHGGGGGSKKGLLLSVAGREGAGNFACVKMVVTSFMRNLGIRPSGELLLGGMDRVRDVRALPDARGEVGRLVRDALGS